MNKPTKAKENKTPGNVFSKRQMELAHQQIAEAVELARQAGEIKFNPEDSDKFVKAVVRSIQLAGIQDTAFGNVREKLSIA